MSDSQPSSDFAALVEASAILAEQHAKEHQNPWETSPFEWILKLPSRTKGAIGEKLVAEWAELQGFDVRRPPSSDADRVINGHRVEIKLSTLWKTGAFKFQQIRDQEYDLCLCLGIMPHDARAWLLPKTILREYVIGHMPQHTGARGLDTFWLGFPADDTPTWMDEFGGTLEQVGEAFKALGQGPF